MIVTYHLFMLISHGKLSSQAGEQLKLLSKIIIEGLTIWFTKLYLFSFPKKVVYICFTSFSKIPLYIFP